MEIPQTHIVQIIKVCSSIYFRKFLTEIEHQFGKFFTYEFIFPFHFLSLSRSLHSSFFEKQTNEMKLMCVCVCSVYILKLLDFIQKKSERMQKIVKHVKMMLASRSNSVGLIA